MDECLLNDLLECSVCLERLDTSSKVLPCQHTFCRKCLEEIVHTHKELRCPECRVLVDVEIDDLPPNVLLMRILEGMRNAPRKSNVVMTYPNDTGTAVDTSATKTTVSCAFTSYSRTRSRLANGQAPQINDSHVPYAIAVCDSPSKELGDLSFKKGDVILLRRKIDHNWYQGECNGVLGVFPQSYVKVMIPLPSHIPQCKALYDFSKYHEDDEGCLHFSKGEVIIVLRRIDENWAEGKLDDRIGIFPISFVEMNCFAKNLMKASFNTSFGSSRDAPPTPTEDSVPLISKEGAFFGGNAQNQSNPERAENVVFPSSSSSSSSSSTSTTTTSPTSSSESTSPTSPSTSPLAVQTQTTATKRHSFTLGAQPPPYHAPPAVHRHSAEILKPDDSIVGSNESTSELSNQRYQQEQQQQRPKQMQTMQQLQSSSSNHQFDDSLTRQMLHRKKLYSQNEQHGDINREMQSLRLAAKELNGVGSFQRQSSLKMSKFPANLHIMKSGNQPALPAMYFAIYPYKPQKTDELELKIGCVYTVIERCQDGWFKGTSHPNQKCGVFPGNYVTPVKSLPALQAQLRGSTPNAGSPRHEIRASSEVRVSTASSRTNTNTITSSTTTTTTTTTTTGCPSNELTARVAPPDLPARAASPLLSSASSHKISATIWHIPMSESSQGGRVKNGNVETESGNTTPQKGSESKSSKPADKNKEKKEKSSVSLMRRLTSMKKSRSPPPTLSAYSIDNPVFEDSRSLVFVPVAHARSDSCPSQLTYNTSSHTATSANTNANLVGGSQRVKHKQRSSLQNQFIRSAETDTNVVHSSPSLSSKTNKDEKPSSNQRKSSLFDATVFDEKQSSHKSSSKPIDPPPRERYRCIAPYPPNSEFELELKVGDVIFVHKKREDGWYKGTLQRTGKTGLFPASFVESV